MTKIISIVGGNFGSEAKGAAAAHLAARFTDDLIMVRVAGPNAGHSAIGKLDGVKYAMCQVPVAAVTNLHAPLYLAAGSEIDPEVLNREVDLLDAAGYDVSSRLIIDGSATYMSPDYAAAEVAGKMFERLGSTAHGIGKARSARIMREALTWEQALDQDSDLAKKYGTNTVTDTGSALTEALADGINVMLEGTQGYGLGLHGQFYPQCTSSDTRTIDFLAMAGISPWGLPGVTVEPWVVVRTFPIRVAGNSGPLANETSWEQLANETNGYIKPEITTVTKRVRRVGRWDGELSRRAIAANGGPEACKVSLGFVDYLQPDLAGSTDPQDLAPQTREILNSMADDMGVVPSLLGTGPGSFIENYEQRRF